MNLVLFHVLLQINLPFISLSFAIETSIYRQMP